MPYEITAIETSNAVDAVRALVHRNVAVMIVELNGLESPVDLRELLSDAGCRCVLMVRDMPPRAAIARIAHSADAVILPAVEAPIVVVATLIAMLREESAVR